MCRVPSGEGGSPARPGQAGRVFNPKQTTREMNHNDDVDDDDEKWDGMGCWLTGLVHCLWRENSDCE